MFKLLQVSDTEVVALITVLLKVARTKVSNNQRCRQVECIYVK